MTLKTRIIQIGQQYGLVILLLAAFTFLHYSHERHLHELHGVYKLFYFLPIILGGFRGGKIGGLVISGLVALAFFPHAFLARCSSCGSTLDKIIEMALYLGVGLLTGTLSDHLKKAKTDLQRTLSEKSAMEEELLRSTRLAAVGQLSAGLAHEIRNPLASIQGSAELLADDFDKTHPKGRMLSILLEEAKRLNTVLTRFLDFARTEPGERLPFDLLSEVKNVTELIRHDPGYSGISCEIKNQDQEIMALGNREQIRQVLLNLALNGAAASGSKGRLTFHVSKNQGFCICRVEDSGPGFTKEAQASFGTPFFSTKPQGTGLGLATSLKIVQDQGGSLKPGEDTGVGGVVIMTLPASDSSSLY